MSREMLGTQFYDCCRCQFRHSGSTQERIFLDRRLCHTAGLNGSTVPFSLAVSGPPVGFVLLSGLFAIFVECLVSLFERPSCLPDCTFLLPACFDVAPPYVDSLV